MRQLSSSGERTIDAIAQRHGFSSSAVLSMLESVINGNGSMAQFSHNEFSGSGQWMRGGMIMVSDMFNHGLKSRIDGLCNELADLITNEPDLIRSGSFQSQRQGGQRQGGSSPGQHQRNDVSGQLQGPNGPVGPVSLFVPAAPGTSGDWWPGDLRWPNSTGAQDGVRYAYFAQARRLAIDVNGRVTLYDTLDHQIGGFSQQQSVGGTLSFNSQHGLIDVASLPIVSSGGAGPATPPPAPFVPASQHGHVNAPAVSHDSVPGHDVFATLEKLADLRAKGVISDEEFAGKKAELLGRL